MKFIIIVALCNREQWLGQAINSIKTRSYGNFRCLLGDDMPLTSSAAVIAKAIRGDSRLELIHPKKKFSIGEY
jgi:hypothetical protein